MSSELPEVMHLAHRTIVMRRGRQVAEFEMGQADAETIVAAASGLNPTAHESPVATFPSSLPTELAA